MGRTVEFKYDIGDIIRIEATQTEGLVEKLVVESMGLVYIVTHWCSGHKITTGLFDHEIDCAIATIRANESEETNE